MRIVITYLHKQDDQYAPLIDMAFASASTLGYETVMVGNIDAGDIHINFPAEREPRLMNWILAAQLAYIESPLFNEPSVLFSPDALIMQRLEPVFDKCFDVAFTDRKNSRWPINNGVIYLKPEHRVRIAALWRDALALCKTYPVETQDWFGDQQALHDVYMQGNHLRHGLVVQLLPCAGYNASPRMEEAVDEYLAASAYVIHLKGKRKDMMKNYWDYLCKKKSFK